MLLFCGLSSFFNFDELVNVLPAFIRLETPHSDQVKNNSKQAIKMNTNLRWKNNRRMINKTGRRIMARVHRLVSYVTDASLATSVPKDLSVLAFFFKAAFDFHA